jgi:hypothetical protein
MTPAELVADLNSKGISLEASGDKLKCKGKESALTPELLETLRERKAELIALLAGMCFCEPPMLPAVIDSLACKECSVSCWCPSCQGCRWCDWRVKWGHHVTTDDLDPPLSGSASTGPPPVRDRAGRCGGSPWLSGGSRREVGSDYPSVTGGEGQLTKTEEARKVTWHKHRQRQRSG